MIPRMVLLYNASRQRETLYLINITESKKWI